MFAKSIISAVVLSLSASVIAGPIAKRTSFEPVSFNNYGGYQHMANFDHFYGADNFSGYHNDIHLREEKHVVCHRERIEVIQQHLAVLREYAKKIITEQVCEVEVQTIAYTQFVSGLHDFTDDLQRHEGRHVGYDHEIASHIGNIHDEHGELSHQDLGFDGHNIGSNYVSPSGNDWDNKVSPGNVGKALSLAQQASGH